MKFSIGDKIVINRTGEEGHVVAFVNKQMVEVDVNGTVFPVYVEDIDHPYLKWFTDKTANKKKTTLPEQLPVEKIGERKQRLAKGVYLSFMPVFKFDGIEDVVDIVKIYLLNELPVTIKFNYDVRLANKSEFRHEGTLHEFGNIYLHSMPYADMNDQPRLHWQLTDTSSNKMEMAEGILRIKPVKLFEHINKILKDGEPTFSYVLINEFSVKKKPEPKEEYIPVIKPHIATIAKPTAESPRYELDLHIEHLVDNTKGLSNADIIKLQLDTLERYLHIAIAHRQERMIIIHGLGKGKLREEVHAILKRTPEVGRFKNEWSARYGFGATEVFFRY